MRDAESKEIGLLRVPVYRNGVRVLTELWTLDHEPRIECFIGQISEVWRHGARVIVLGSPDEDSDHNCDCMGCGQAHVLMRT